MIEAVSAHDVRDGTLNSAGIPSAKYSPNYLPHNGHTFSIVPCRSAVAKKLIMNNGGERHRRRIVYSHNIFIHRRAPEHTRWTWTSAGRAARVACFAAWRCVGVGRVYSKGVAARVTAPLRYERPSPVPACAREGLMDRRRCGTGRAKSPAVTRPAIDSTCSSTVARAGATGKLRDAGRERVAAKALRRVAATLAPRDAVTDDDDRARRLFANTDTAPRFLLQTFSVRFEQRTAASASGVVRPCDAVTAADFVDVRDRKCGGVVTAVLRGRLLSAMTAEFGTMGR